MWKSSYKSTEIAIFIRRCFGLYCCVRQANQGAEKYLQGLLKNE